MAGTLMISRRNFLHVSGLSAGGLLIGCSTLDEVPAAAADASDRLLAAASPPEAVASFGAYIEITPDNRVLIVTPQSEMGQGVHDGLPRIVAEELDADWALVTVRMPWADDRFINPITKRHRTANSESTMVYFELLRRAGASARQMLLDAAAAHWQVPVAELTAERSFVLHAASVRRASFGELAAAASTLAPPATPRLKSPQQFALLGRTLPRTDTPAKCDGSATFGIDIREPGMLYAALRRSPAVTSRILRFDRDAALAIRGVFDAFEIPDGIAVVAGSTWQATQAAEKLDVTFDDSAAITADSKALHASMVNSLANDAAAMPGRPAFGGPPYSKEATLAAIAAAPVRHEWQYEVPFLAHAALEPLCATVRVDADGCEAWVPSQQPDRARDALAQVTGLPRDRCKLHITFLGGGFGRKWEVDFVRQAAQIAVRVKGRPVKLMWTREQDFRHDRFRPAHIARTRVGLSRQGEILGMHSRTTGISMWKYQGRPAIPGYGDMFSGGLLINDRYDFPNKFVDIVDVDAPIPVGTWRSVSQSMNTFFSESAIDEIAHHTRTDRLALRLKLCGSDPRAQAVLKLAAEKAGWGRALPKGHGLGIAFAVGYDAYCAQVVEVKVEGRNLRIERIVCAFDCGMIIDPRAVEAQVEGGIVFGLSAARDGRITFEGGAARESNFHDSALIRIHETPRIEVHLLRTDHKAGGCGEASVPPVAPALASAVFAATGRRARQLPIIENGYELV